MATVDRLWISEEDLQTKTDLGKNYNRRSLRNAVIDAQVLGNESVQGIIGLPLYTTIDNFIANATVDGSTGVFTFGAGGTDYQNLLNNFIQPYHVERSYWYLLETIFTTPSNNGLGRRNPSPDTGAISSADFNDKRDLVESRMYSLGEKLKEELIFNSNLYSELSETPTKPSDRPNLEQGTTGGSPLITRRTYGNR